MPWLLVTLVFVWQFAGPPHYAIAALVNTTLAYLPVDQAAALAFVCITIPCAIGLLPELVSTTARRFR